MCRSHRPACFVVAAAALDTFALRADGRVTYRSTRGHRLDVRFAPCRWLPRASVNGTPLDLDRWPICGSPYLSCRAAFSR